MNKVEARRYWKLWHTVLGETLAETRWNLIIHDKALLSLRSELKSLRIKFSCGCKAFYRKIVTSFTKVEYYM